MKQFGKYIICTFIVLIGVSWFFQKINKHDFYSRYFRIIAEINVRNSHALSFENVEVVAYQHVALSPIHISAIAIFIEKYVTIHLLSVSDKQYFHSAFPHILAFLSTKMKENIPFSIAPPTFILA